MALRRPNPKKVPNAKAKIHPITHSVDMGLFEELVAYYDIKRQLHVQGATYRRSQQNDQYFFRAALLCEKHNMNAEAYVHLAYERINPQGRSRFAPMHLQGEALEKHLVAYQRENVSDYYTCEGTLGNIDYPALWDQNMETLELMCRNHKVEDVLTSSITQFQPWFRVLCTEHMIPSVMHAWKAIADKQVRATPNLRKFLVSIDAPLERL